MSLEEVDKPGARDVVRQMIFEENRLRDQRLGYLLALNGFLFAALAFAWDVAESDALVGLIGVVGTAAGISAVASMRISDFAIGRLRDWSDEKTCPRGTTPDRHGEWEKHDDVPPVVGMRGDLPDPTTQALAPWKMLPFALAFIWPAVVAVKFAV